MEMRNSAVAVVGKRAVDLTGAALLIALLAPVLLAIAVLVKLTSAGTVLFAQERVGRRGKRFRVHKFRTMCGGAEEILRATPDLYARYVAGGYKLSDEEDPRITPLGRLLRRSGLDELPQLFDVLSGDMSLVGPRPIVPPELEQYPEYLALIRDCKPGITGCWQVSGGAYMNYTLRAELERHYAMTHSLRADLAIIARTVRMLGARFVPDARATQRGATSRVVREGGTPTDEG